ncbi:MAG: 1-deoxy-D-xylulose-5-phosphate reductoisomerase [Eubacteriales bacterium]|nr:1-deoxy-D-xylulose-5-phosphate reductoisomerase [Eubacteriales bacterium]
MMHNISILGSTGSIGRQTADVCRRLGLRVTALAAHRDIMLLEQQAREFRPRLAAVYDPAAAKELRIALADTDIRVAEGASGLEEAACIEDTDAVVTAVSGSVGLKPTLAAIDLRRRIALANKETLVCAGSLVMARAREKNCEILPVDSEHSAIFQCLEGRPGSQLRRIWLTASGGPFRGMSLAETAKVTPQMAVRHPNWSMGAKISVDSATMMNKGLEFIEAMHLFGVTADKIRVLIHPESVIHSCVELRDGAVIAQLGVPSMTLPIQYALTWPERRETDCDELNLAQLGKLTFEDPCLEDLPCLSLALDCARRGGTAPCVLSAANEAAVSLFLNGKLSFHGIAERVARALELVPFDPEPSLETILACDEAARIATVAEG